MLLWVFPTIYPNAEYQLGETYPSTELRLLEHVTDVTGNGKKEADVLSTSRVSTVEAVAHV